MDTSTYVRRRRQTLAPTTETGEDGDFVQLRLIRLQAIALRENEELLPDDLDSELDKNGLKEAPSRPTPMRTASTVDWVGGLFDAIENQDRKTVDRLLSKARKLSKIENVRHPKTDESVLHFTLSRGWKEFGVELINKEPQELVLSYHLVKQSGIQGKRNCLHLVTEMNDIQLAMLILDKIPNSETRLALMQMETAIELQGQRPRLFSCLHLAAHFGYANLVRLFLDQGIPVNLKNGKHDTALLWAARWGHNDTVSLLLDRGADPEIPNDKGSTALYWAIRYQLADTVKLLLSKGKANPNTTRKLGLVAPIIIASAYGNADIVSELLKCPNIDVNMKIRGGDTAIHNAAREGWLPVVQLLIRSGARFDESDDLGDTPLLLAASHDHVKVVQALVKAGADINVRNYAGHDIWYFAINSEKNSLLKALISSKMTATSERNPMIIAASLGKCEKIQFLLDMNYNPSNIDVDGNTFLHHAALQDKSSVIDTFHSVGSVLNAQNSAGNTALHIACLKGFSNSIKSLLNCKAKADLKNLRGETALHVAASSKDITSETAKTVVEYVIKSHAWESLHAKDFEGNNCLHIAGKFAKPQVLWEFRFVRVNDKDKDGKTPLHEAVRTGEPEALETMLDIFETSKRDASINEQTYETRETVLHLAGEEGHARCVKRLIDLGADIAIQDVNGDTVLHRLIKAFVYKEKNIMKQFEVFDTIFDRIVYWWCLKSNSPFPESFKDTKAMLYKKKAVLYMLNHVKNNEGLSVLNQAFKAGVPEVLSKLLMMPGVTMEEGAVYAFDITGLTPRTNREMTSCCGSSRILPANEKQELKEKEVSVSGLELLITSKALYASDILDLPPVKMIERYYTSMVAWTFVLLLVLHIIYMSLFTYLSLSVLEKLRENSSEINASDAETVLMYVIVPIEPAIIVIYLMYSIFHIVQTRDVSRRSKLIDRTGVIFLITLIRSYVFLGICAVFAALVYTWLGLFTERNSNQDYVLSAALCIGWLLSISFTRGIQAIHYFYKMLLNMILRDVLRFIIVYLFVLLSFAFAFHALFQISPDVVADYSTPATTLFVTFNMMIGMGDLFDEQFETNMAKVGRSTTYAKVLYLFYIVLSTIVLLNLLIAMMNDSYSMILSEKQVRWRIESVSLGVEIESTFPISRTFSNVKMYPVGTDVDSSTSDRWYVQMPEADYLSSLLEIQKKSSASTDAVSRRLDDLESKMSVLLKQTNERFEQLTEILSAEKIQRKKSKRRESERRKSVMFQE